MLETRRNRTLILLTALASLVLFVVLVGDRCRHSLIWNATPSIPTGLYYLSAPANPNIGDLIYFDAPADQLQLARARGYIPPRGRFLKPVGATPGARYCILDIGLSLHLFTVQTEPRGFVYPTDTLGRPLPSRPGCHTVPHAHVLPVAPYPRSYDGRYTGPIPVESIDGIAHPLYVHHSSNPGA